MSKFPHLPLFTDAFIADTMQLSAAETGAYLMLMMCAWRSPGCRLPNNDVQLARFARVEPRHWPRIKAAVMPYWTLDEEGFWINKRLLKEHVYCCRIAAVARQNGAQHRGAKSLKTKEGGNPAGNPAGTQIDVPIPRKKGRKKEIPPPIVGGAGGAETETPPPVVGGATTRERLPSDWKPSEEERRIARDAGFTEAEVDPLAAEYADYWHGVKGEKGKKADWFATWRNRVHDVAARRRLRPTQPTGPPFNGSRYAHPNDHFDPARIQALLDEREANRHAH